MLKPQPLDISRVPIHGALNNIAPIQNFTTVAGEWYPVTMDYEESKQLMLQPRSEVDWLVATTSGGDYFTMRKGAILKAPLVTTSGTIICWIKTSGAEVFELMAGR